METWTSVALDLLFTAILFALLTVLDIFGEKKLREYYFKKSAELDEEEKELRRRLQERQSH